jgi:hypothetical protein
LRLDPTGGLDFAKFQPTETGRYRGLRRNLYSVCYQASRTHKKSRNQETYETIHFSPCQEYQAHARTPLFFTLSVIHQALRAKNHPFSADPKGTPDRRPMQL